MFGLDVKSSPAESYSSGPRVKGVHRLIPVLVALQLGGGVQQSGVDEIQHEADRPVNALILNAGEQVILTDEHGVVTAHPSGVNGSKHAVEQRPAPLRFTGEPLTRVVADVNRYSSDRLVIADEGIRDLKIVGSFEPMPFRGLLSYLKARYGIAAITLGVDEHARRVIALARVNVRAGDGQEKHGAITR
jgi:ferric-dicitrate binding protein FerR (iron transport regulator)